MTNKERERLISDLKVLQNSLIQFIDSEGIANHCKDIEGIVNPETIT
jgi:hypothetical protein